MVRRQAREYTFIIYIDNIYAYTQHLRNKNDVLGYRTSYVETFL
jgi:hypothetical protein